MKAGLSGFWKSSVYLSTARIEIRQRGAHVKGVAQVHSLFGQEDTYHFSGTFLHGKIELTHDSGKRFVGIQLSSRKITGILSLPTRDVKIILYKIGTLPK